ncbi:MAG: arginine--tRNA ligase [Spirochaetia bacterium]
MRKYRDTWRARIAEALAGAAADAGISGLDTSALVTETPPRPDMGDIAFPMFPFARAFRKAPPVIAREVVKHVTTGSKEADRVEAAGPYVNVRLAPGPVIQDILHDVSEQAELFGKGQTLTNQRITLEFSCPNTNKPLHLGHLRNDAIGESLSRILLAAGATLRKVNLINDRGVHICKSMLAYQMFGGSTTPQSAGMKGDHFVGDFYVKYAQHAKDHPEAEEQVREMLRRWEDGDPDTVALWKKMNSWVMSGIEQTYKRTGISFDQVYFESDVYQLGRQEVLAGLGKGIFQKDPDGSVWVDLTDDGMEREVLLRSDGTSIYLTQDIGTAIQRSKDWQFDRMIYVVGSEQRHHFQVLFKVLARLGHPWASNLHHLAYGMVNLPEGKMKSREGTVVDADDLLDELERLAAEEIRAKEREDDVADLSGTARDVALGALHYWLLQVTAGKDMTFDPKESISFNGDTGPYLQYTGARISSMLRKFEERREKFRGGSYSSAALSLPEEWEIAKSLALFPEIVGAAANELNPSILAAYLFELCKSFSRYYQDHPVLRNEDSNLVVSRIALVRAVLQVLRNGLSLLGIPFLSAM